MGLEVLLVAGLADTRLEDDGGGVEPSKVADCKSDCNTLVATLSTENGTFDGVVDAGSALDNIIEGLEMTGEVVEMLEVPPADVDMLAELVPIAQISIVE